MRGTILFVALMMVCTFAARSVLPTLAEGKAGNAVR